MSTTIAQPDRSDVHHHNSCTTAEDSVKQAHISTPEGEDRTNCTTTSDHTQTAVGSDNCVASKKRNRDEAGEDSSRNKFKRVTCDSGTDEAEDPPRNPDPVNDSCEAVLKVTLIDILTDKVAHGQFASNASFHPTHNYEDGSIIILMQDMLFRLPRSLLSRKSTYFAKICANMTDLDFEHSNPPILCVNTCATSFAVLLDALDDFTVLINPTLATIAAILRSSTDLKFPTLRKWAVKSLEDMWPSTIGVIGVQPRCTQEAAKSIYLARKYDIPRVLKRALYDVSRAFSFSVAHCIADSIFVAEESREKLVPLLNSEDLTTLSLAHDSMPRFLLKTIVPRPRIVGCKRTSRCITIGFWNDVISLPFFAKFLYDPVICLTVLSGLPYDGSEPCRLSYQSLTTNANEKTTFILRAYHSVATREVKHESFDWCMSDVR